MPLPQPQPMQSKDKFIEYCMSDEMMIADYKNRDQRFAVCNKQWENKDKK